VRETLHSSYQLLLGRDCKQSARRGLSQGSPSHSSERPSLRRALEIKRGMGCCYSRLGESSSLKRELFILSDHPARLGKFSRTHLLSPMPNQIQTTP